MPTLVLNMKHILPLPIRQPDYALGMFLIGFYVGRRKILENVSAHLPLIRKTMWWGLALGLLFNTVYVIASARPEMLPGELAALIRSGSLRLGGPPLTLFYISLIIMLSRKPAMYQTTT